MADISDARLEALLRSTMRAEEAALPVTLRPADILRRRAHARRELIRRSGMRLLLVAAALLLPLGALWVASRPSAIPRPSIAAILVRGLEEQAMGELSPLEVVAAAADGTETLVRTILPDQLPQTIHGMWASSVSPDGWLLLSLDDGSEYGTGALVDLRRPNAEPMPLSSDRFPTWSPNGRLWVGHDSPGRIEALDPDTGHREVMLDPVPEELTTRQFHVAADGTGVVVRGGSGYVCEYGQQYDDQGWVTVRAAGSTEATVVPTFNDGQRRILSPRWGPLGVSATPIRLCPGHTEPEYVSGPDSHGAYQFWPKVSRDFADFRGAAYQATDDGVWVIGSINDEGASLFKVGPTDPDDIPAVARWEGHADGYFISAMSLDDSLIAVTGETDEPFTRRHLLVDTATGRVTEVDGAVAGFLDPADLWRPDALAP
jgi:hypothetical protein